MTPETAKTPRAWLEQEYEKRRAKNGQYSLRAFANLLGIPSGRLSEVLSSKRPLTPRKGAQIAERLAYSPERRADFLDCIQRERLGRKTPAMEAGKDYSQLSLDAFQAIADWWHFAILALIETSDFRREPAWIARRLGISVVEARAAVDRLLRLELVEEEGSTLKLTRTNLTTSHDIQSAALRRSHRQSLEQAIETLETVPLEERDITSITMAINPRKLVLAKAMIRDFRRKLSAVLETGEKNEVYNLNVQLVPVSKRTQSKRKSP